MKLGCGRLLTAGSRALGLALLGLFEAVAVGVDLEELGAVNEAIDESDGTSGVGEDLGPVLERFVGAHEDGLVGMSESQSAMRSSTFPNSSVNGIAKLGWVNHS